jgi:predicted DNA binding CopG/RHH family protein
MKKTEAGSEHFKKLHAKRVLRTLTVRVPQELLTRLKITGAERQTTVQELTRKALGAYLDALSKE